VSTISSPGPRSRPEGATHGEGERGHVCAEDDFVGVAIQKVGHGGARFVEDAVGVVAGLIGAVGVGIVARQIVGDGVDYTPRNLRAAGSIHEDSRMSVNRLR
jgi:hypothetical protein